jgi:hypothetical protein
MPEVRFLQLSPARRTLVRVLQIVNFGEIQGLQVRESDPIFDSATVAILDLKLDREDSRPELDLADFALSAEVINLISWLDELKSGTIRRLEVRAGLPRRLLFEPLLSELMRLSSAVR